MSKNSNGAEDESEPILDVALDDADDAVKHLPCAKPIFRYMLPSFGQHIFSAETTKTRDKKERKSERLSLS